MKCARGVLLGRIARTTRSRPIVTEVACSVVYLCLCVSTSGTWVSHAITDESIEMLSSYKPLKTAEP